MCDVYSVARVTRRWSLVIFFSLMDVAGINAQAIFCANEKNKKYKRRIFLKNLKFSPMKPQLVNRGGISSLPADVTAFLRKYKEPQAEVVAEPIATKISHCATCGPAKNTSSSTTIRCDACHCFVCKDHVKITRTCEECLLSLEDAEEML